MKEGKYWQNGQAHLGAVDMDIQLNEGQSFSDKGYVPYIRPHSSSNGYSLNGQKIIEVLGRCGHFRDLSRVEIYYLEKTPEETLHTRGHEETHALFYLGRLSDLYEEFKLMNLNPKPTHFNSERAEKHDIQIKSILENKQKLRDRGDLDLFGNEELLAHLGGVLALKKANYTDNEIRKFIREWRYISPITLDCL